jgi:hypothetical protein
MKEQKNDDMYSQKEVINILLDMKGDMAALRNDLTETQTLIRDYNNLRATINEVKNNLTQYQAISDTRKKEEKDIGSALYSKVMIGLYFGMFLISLYSTIIHK